MCERLPLQDVYVEASMLDFRALAPSILDETFCANEVSLNATRAVLGSVVDKLAYRTPLATDGQYLPLSTLRCTVGRKLFVPMASLSSLPKESPLHVQKTSRQGAFYSRSTTARTHNRNAISRDELHAALAILPHARPSSSTLASPTTSSRVLDLRRALVSCMPMATDVASSIASSRQYAAPGTSGSFGGRIELPPSWAFAVSELILALVHVLSLFTSSEQPRMQSLGDIPSLARYDVTVSTTSGSSSRADAVNIVSLAISCLSRRWGGTTCTAVLTFDEVATGGKCSISIESCEDLNDEFPASMKALSHSKAIMGSRPFGAATISPRRRATAFCQIALFLDAMLECDSHSGGTAPEAAKTRIAVEDARNTASRLARYAVREDKLDDALRKSDTARAAVGSFVPPWLLSLAVADAQNAIRGYRLRVESGILMTIQEAQLVCSCHSLVFFMTFAIRMTSAIRLRFGTGVSVSLKQQQHRRAAQGTGMSALAESFRCLSRVLINIANAKRKIGRLSVALGADNPAVASTVAEIDYPYPCSASRSHLSPSSLNSPPCLGQIWDSVVGGDGNSSSVATHIRSEQRGTQEREQMIRDFAFVMLYASPITLGLLEVTSHSALTVDIAVSEALPLIPPCDYRFGNLRPDKSGSASSLRTRRAITPIMQHVTGGCRWTVQMCRGLLVRQVRDVHELQSLAHERCEMTALSYGMGHSVAAVEASYRIGSPVATALRALGGDDVESFAGKAIGAPALNEFVARYVSHLSTTVTSGGVSADEAETSIDVWQLFLRNPVSALALGIPHLVTSHVQGTILNQEGSTHACDTTSFWPDAVLVQGGFTREWGQRLSTVYKKLQAEGNQKVSSAKIPRMKHLSHQTLTYPLTLELWTQDTLAHSTVLTSRTTTYSESGKAFRKAAIDLYISHTANSPGIRHAVLKGQGLSSHMTKRKDINSCHGHGKGRSATQWDRLAMYRCVLGLAGSYVQHECDRYSAKKHGTSTGESESDGDNNSDNDNDNDSASGRGGDSDSDSEINSDSDSVSDSGSASGSASCNDNDEVREDYDMLWGGGFEGDYDLEETCNDNSNVWVKIVQGSDSEEGWTPAQTGHVWDASRDEGTDDGYVGEDEDLGENKPADDEGREWHEGLERIDGGRVRVFVGVRRFMTLPHFSAVLAASQKEIALKQSWDPPDVENVRVAKRLRVSSTILPKPLSVEPTADIAMAWCVGDQALQALLKKRRLTIIRCTTDYLPRLIQLADRKSFKMELHASLWTGAVRFIAAMQIKMSDFADDVSNVQRLINIIEQCVASPDKGPADDTFSPSLITGVIAVFIDMLQFLATSQDSYLGKSGSFPLDQGLRMFRGFQRRLALCKVRRGDAIARNVRSQAMRAAGTLHQGTDSIFTTLGDCIAECLLAVPKVSIGTKCALFSKLVEDVARGRRMCAGLLYILLGAPARPAHIVYAAGMFGRHVGIEHLSPQESTRDDQSVRCGYCNDGAPCARHDAFGSIRLVFQRPISIDAVSGRSRLLRHPLPPVAQLALGFLLLTSSLPDGADVANIDARSRPQGVSILYPHVVTRSRRVSATRQHKATVKEIEGDILRGLCEGGVFGAHRPTRMADVREWVFTEAMREAPHYRNVLMSLQGRSYAEEERKRRGASAFG
jgi:hypothetical protein